MFVVGVNSLLKPKAPGAITTVLAAVEITSATIPASVAGSVRISRPASAVRDASST